MLKEHNFWCCARHKCLLR